MMLREMLEVLGPVGGLRIIDGTFGAGGYSRALLNRNARVTAIDRDPGVQRSAEELAQEFGSSFRFVRGRFGEMDKLAEAAGAAGPDAIVLDIGVSSMQLDDATRGFSFMREGPLDMRMGGAGKTAADIVNTYDQRALGEILFAFGEERKSTRIAGAVVEARKESPIRTTLELADIIEETIGRKPGGNHPATKTFQALRIAVNAEFDELVEGLFAAERLLSEGGKLVVVTFHSLEDRIVKRFFAGAKKSGQQSRHLPPAEVEAVRWAPVAKAAKPSVAEIEANPRARSATLRWAARTGEEARTVSFAGLGVPLSSLRGAA
ncbi:MAG TPA: 16S rRNA (cytosine(1402)-N(4))-methyltransferase RsmH [Devosia sp.]|nr:16S rRNA (cytosine(1402)-N(4))-methyltransferase RsmH [Devosia sp.]